jgi:hypothetical protein
MRLGKFDLCWVRNLNCLAEGIFRGFPILFGVFTIMLSSTVTLCLSEFGVFLNFFVVLTNFLSGWWTPKTRIKNRIWISDSLTGRVVCRESSFRLLGGLQSPHLLGQAVQEEISYIIRTRCVPQSRLCVFFRNSSLLMIYMKRAVCCENNTYTVFEECIVP